MTFKTKSDAFDLAVAELRASSLFRQWKRPAIERSNLTKDGAPALMAEKHYTPAELAETWGVDPETIRNLFRDEPGVLKIANNNKKRSYVTLRIPESVAERVHQRLSA